MSRKDHLGNYSQMYAKAQAKVIVPDGPFVRQLNNIPRRQYDIGIFFKPNRSNRCVQIHLGEAIPKDICMQEGFLETDHATYLSRSILSNFRTLDFLRVVISAGDILESKEERLELMADLQESFKVRDNLKKLVGDLCWTIENSELSDCGAVVVWKIYKDVKQAVDVNKSLTNKEGE